MARLLLDESISNRITPIEELKATGLWFKDWDERARERKKIVFLRDLYLHVKDGKPLDANEQKFLNAHTNMDLFQTYSHEESRYFDVLANMAVHDLSAYHEYINPHEVPAKHHRFICDKMQDLESRKTRLVLLSLPPGSAKSSYASKSFIQWYMGRNPTHKVLAGGYGIKFICREFSTPNKHVITSPEYRDVFPDISIDPAYRSADLWALNGFGGRYTVRSVGASTSGIRANAVILDDIIGGAESALSEKERHKAIQWLTADIFPRVLPGAFIFMIGTRWFSEDPMGYVEKMIHDNPGKMLEPYEIVNISAEGSEENPFVEEGKWLWEEFYGASHYINIKTTLAPSLWSATYLGIPMDELGEYIGHDDIKYYKNYPSTTHKDAPHISITVDAAQKSTSGSNRTAVIAVAKYENGEKRVIDAWAGKKPLFEIVTEISNMAKKHNAHIILIEDAAMGSQILENYALSFTCPVKGISPQQKGSKQFNVESFLLPAVQSGVLLFPEKTTWASDLINEIVAFPSGKYDDYPDALSQYVREHTRRRKFGAKRISMSI